MFDLHGIWKNSINCQHWKLENSLLKSRNLASFEKNWKNLSSNSGPLMAITRWSYEVAVPFRQGVLSDSSDSLSPPLRMHLASSPLWSALPGSAALWVCDCWLISPRALLIRGTISNRKGRVCTWKKKLHLLLFCLSKGRFSYSSPPNIPNIGSTQFHKNLSGIFCISNPLPPNRLKNWMLRHLPLLRVSIGHFFSLEKYLQNARHQFCFISSSLWKRNLTFATWLYIKTILQSKLWNLCPWEKNEVGLNVIGGTFPMKRAPRI